MCNRHIQNSKFKPGGRAYTTPCTDRRLLQQLLPFLVAPPIMMKPVPDRPLLFVSIAVGSGLEFFSLFFFSLDCGRKCSIAPATE